MAQDRPSRAQRTTRWILPPAASIAVHAGLLIALTAVTIEVTREKEPPRPERVTLAAPPTRPNNQPDSQPPSQTPGATSAPGSIPAPSEPAAIARALADAAGPGPATTAALAPPAPAPVTDAILSPANASSPTVRFAEIDAAPARTVVFVVDASGAVASAFTFVREELLRSIDQLSPTQRFQVIVFPGPENSPPVAAPIGRNGSLALATPAAKGKVAEWMATFRPRGQSKPLAGLKDALALRPDIVMLITRSIERTGPDAAWGDGLHESLAELDALNPTDGTGRRRTAIAAVQLLDEDPTGIMPAIAARHGHGVSDYRVVTADALASMQPRLPRPAGTAGTIRNHTIDAAAAILAELDDTGAALRLLHGLPNAADRGRADEQAQRAANLAARTPDDARARVLLARAQSLTNAPTPESLAPAIHTLTEELLHDADADAWRRLALIDALTLAGRPADALTELAALQTDAKELPLADATRARIATTAAALSQEPTDAASDDTDDPYWTLALAEARTRARLRDPRATDHYEPLLTLLDRAERERAPDWPAVLTDRIARAADLAPATADAAPPRARLIIAEHWARTPATQPDARRLLATLIDADSPLRPAALWRLALLERSASPATAASTASAAQLFAALATDHPADPNAPDALAAAVALTTDPATRQPLLERATQTLPSRPEIDLWRLSLAEMLEAQPRLDALEPIAPGTRESTLARALYTETAEPLFNAASPDAQRTLALRTAAYLARHDSPDAPRWLARAAESRTTADPVRAIELAEQAIARATALAQPTAQAELILARAQLMAKRTANASTTLRALAARLDPQADGPHFWEAWTLLLETAGPEDPASARAHLARLELLDPALGGDPWSPRLRTLRTQLSTP